MHVVGKTILTLLKGNGNHGADLVTREGGPELMPSQDYWTQCISVGQNLLAVQTNFLRGLIKTPHFLLTPNAEFCAICSLPAT